MYHLSASAGMLLTKGLKHEVGPNAGGGKQLVFHIQDLVVRGPKAGGVTSSNSSFPEVLFTRSWTVCEKNIRLVSVCCCTVPNESIQIMC